MIRGTVLPAAAQAAALDRWTSSAGAKPHAFLALGVPEETLRQRALGRRIDPINKKTYNLVTKPPPAELVARLVRSPRLASPRLASPPCRPFLLSATRLAVPASARGAETT